MSKIIITGATGLIGRRLCTTLSNRGDKLTIFTSDINKAGRIIKGAHEFIKWDYNKPFEWEECIEGKYAVIHLAGSSIAGRRWDDEYKNSIFNSRKISTQSLVDAIGKVKNKPSVFISASASGIYGNRGDEILTEISSSGNDFLSSVCRAWEEEAAKVEPLNVRRISIRTGVALSKDGGALKQMLLPFKLFIGGPLGNGKQWFPWIHIDDLINIYLFALDNPEINGAINAVSPIQITMNEFAKTLGNILHRPSIFKVPLFALRIAIGEASEAVIASQRVIPQRLLNFKYKFKYENVEKALRDML